jgi:hypothetical protein
LAGLVGLAARMWSVPDTPPAGLDLRSVPHRIVRRAADSEPTQE